MEGKGVPGPKKLLDALPDGGILCEKAEEGRHVVGTGFPVQGVYAGSVCIQGMAVKRKP